jgi:hypothetical protein
MLIAAALRDSSRACDHVPVPSRRHTSSVRSPLGRIALCPPTAPAFGAHFPIGDAQHSITVYFCSYLFIVRSFAGGRDAAPITGYGLANAGKTAAAIIKVHVAVLEEVGS